MFRLLFLQFNILCFCRDFHRGENTEHEMSLPNKCLRAQHSTASETLWSRL